MGDNTTLLSLLTIQAGPSGGQCVFTNTPVASTSNRCAGGSAVACRSAGEGRGAVHRRAEVAAERGDGDQGKAARAPAGREGPARILEGVQGVLGQARQAGACGRP